MSADQTTDQLVERLRAALCPVLPLAESDGLTVVLVAVEAWSSTVILRVAVTAGDEEVGPIDPLGLGPAAGPAALRLMRVPLRLEDDLGTRYALTGGTDSGEPPWRIEYRFTPGAPADARRLSVAAQRPDGPDRTVDLELP